MGKRPLTPLRRMLAIEDHVKALGFEHFSHFVLNWTLSYIETHYNEPDAPNFYGASWFLKDGRRLAICVVKAGGKGPAEMAREAGYPDAVTAATDRSAG